MAKKQVSKENVAELHDALFEAAHRDNGHIRTGIISQLLAALMRQHCAGVCADFREIVQRTDARLLVYLPAVRSRERTIALAAPRAAAQNLLTSLPPLRRL